VINDFEPVAMVTRDTGQMIVAKKTMPADNLNQLLTWLRANPGKASLGHTGPGSPPHVSSMLFQRQLGISLQNVSYRNAGQAMQDVIGGHIDMMFTSPSIALAPVQSGSIKAYAVLAKERLKVAPDIPTGDEAGLPRFYTAGWHAFWAPRNTPGDLIATLNAAIVNALTDSAVQSRLTELGLLIIPRGQQTPEALRAFQKAEIDRWWPILREAGIKGE
jgi:tripartite-type tricarboxylate transporter receptor subunit TctC